MTSETRIFCKVCGHAQEQPGDYCGWCGARLVALADKRGNLPIDPTAGRNKEGVGVILFVLNIITYHYYSHYWGTVAMIFSALVWAWGRSENWYKNRIRPEDPPEVVVAKRLLRLKLTRQGLGFILFMAGAFVFYKYHRLVGGVLGLAGIYLGFHDFWMKALRRRRSS